MAAFSHVVLVLLMYSIQNCWAQDNNKSILTFQPPKIKLTPNTTSSGTRINISCQPPSGVIDVLGLVLSKRNKSNPSQLVDLVKALSIKNNGDATLATPLPGASASGTVNDRKITLEMSKASCSDEGSYVCAVSYYSTTLKEARDEDELKVEVSPGEITMTSSPPNPSRVWNENSTLTLTCSGPVGSVNTTGSTDDPQIRWRWEYRKSGVSWSPYDGEEQDINTQSLISRSCYKTQTSTLTRRLTVADSQREYRCYVMRNSQGFTQFAQSYQVGSVTVSGGGNLPESDNTSKANTGAIVGGVFGALICVAVVIIIIYFVVIRPRRRKAQEKSVTGDGDESTTMDSSSVSALSSARSRSVLQILGVNNSAVTEFPRGAVDTEDRQADTEDRQAVSIPLLAVKGTKKGQHPHTLGQENLRWYTVSPCDVEKTRGGRRETEREREEIARGPGVTKKMDSITPILT